MCNKSYLVTGMTWIRTKINHIEVTQTIAIYIFIKERNKKRKLQIYCQIKSLYRSKNMCSRL